MPKKKQEALLDLVRRREAAKKDQLRARHQLGKFLLRHGQRPTGMKAWTKAYMEWIKTHVHFAESALESTLADCLEEVDPMAGRIVKLEKAPPQMRAVVEALQALRGRRRRLCTNSRV